MFDKKVNKGVILAAGDGDRLGSLTATCPKVLLIVNDKPLISYPIEALAAAGISEIAIVVGYLADTVTQALGDGSSFGVRLQYIFNPDYLGGNAISVHKAKDWAQGDPIVLCMGDHLIEPKLAKHLVDRLTLTETLCIDYTPAKHIQLAEATKVAVDSAGYINHIGKDLVHWNALDTGLFLLTHSFFRALDELVPKLGIDIEMSDVIRLLVRRGDRFRTCSVSGHFWADVDTPEDLNAVRM
ncbi:MAG: NTP transferase domain-containing protein [Dehalococcoidia bacterium]|nr:NTP transferase domain-containing protein [Dehalococcoidia bacterium]